MNFPIITTRDDLRDIMAELMPPLYEMPPEVVELEKLKRKEALTTKEVEKLYNLNANTLNKRRTEGDGTEFIKDGDRVLYTHAAVKKYPESRRQLIYGQ